jgi:hypothetical protein
MDDEFKAAKDREAAESVQAQWRNTPLAKKYPELQQGSSTAGGVAGFLAGMLMGRRPVTRYNQAAQRVSDRWKAAIDTANDASLPAATRNQARRTAQAAAQEFADLHEPRLGVLNRIPAGVMGAGLTDLGMMLPTAVDYASSFSDPEGTLHDFSADQLNPWMNPGRYAVGATLGGTAGVVGQELGDLFTGRRDVPTYEAETTGLPARYSSPRKPSAPRVRKR